MKPVKSAASQPLVEAAGAPGRWMTRSTAYSGLVTSALSAGVRLVEAWNWNPEAYDGPPTTLSTGAVRGPL